MKRVAAAVKCNALDGTYTHGDGEGERSTCFRCKQLALSQSQSCFDWNLSCNVFIVLISEFSFTAQSIITCNLSQSLSTYFISGLSLNVSNCAVDVAKRHKKYANFIMHTVIINCFFEIACVSLVSNMCPPIHAQNTSILFFNALQSGRELISRF